MADKVLAVTDMRISFISGNDKHVALDVKDVSASLKLLGKGEAALALAELADFGATVLNAHEDASKIHIAPSGDSKSIVITPKEAAELFE